MQQMEFGNYATEQKKEENIFNGADHYIKAWQNKKPEFDYVEVESMTATSATIKAKATDEDGENLTYKLFYGLDRDNLEEKDKKQDIKQGQEVQFEMTGIDVTKVYYYKVSVLDQYVKVDSEIKETKVNNVPVITPTITRDITVNSSDPTQSTSWIQISTKVEDIDNDKLDIEIYLGTEIADNLGESDLIGKQTNADTRSNINI